MDTQSKLLRNRKDALMKQYKLNAAKDRLKKNVPNFSSIIYCNNDGKVLITKKDETCGTVSDVKFANNTNNLTSTNIKSNGKRLSPLQINKMYSTYRCSWSYGEKSYVSKPGCIEEVSEEKVDTNIYDVVGFDHTNVYSSVDIVLDKDENGNYKYNYFNIWLYYSKKYQKTKIKVSEIFNNFNKKNSLIIPFQLYDFKQLNDADLLHIQFPDKWKQYIGSSDKEVIYKYFCDNFPPRITFMKFNGNYNRQDFCKVTCLYQNYYTNKIIKKENSCFGYFRQLVNNGNSLHVGSQTTRDEWLKSSASEMILITRDKDLKIQEKLIFFHDCEYIYQK